MPADSAYDHIILGSSPLMLIHALWLRRLGNKILVLDRMQNIGGAWALSPVFSESNRELGIIWNSALAEGACHLIEPFPFVYKVIEYFSKVPFTPLDVQPIRLTSQGRIFPYSSRPILIASGIRLLFGSLCSGLSQSLGRTNNIDLYLNFKNKLSTFLRYQLPILFGDIRVWGPSNGFADLISNFEYQCRSEGVEFQLADVTNINRTPSHWNVITSTSSSPFLAANIHLTSSTNLRLTTSGDFIATTPRLFTKTTWVIEISAQHIRTLQTYVAFWNNPSIARISRIISPPDSPSGSPGFYQYLIETRSQTQDVMTRAELVHLFKRSLEIAHIISPDCPFEIIGRVFCKTVSNCEQLPTGNIAPNVWSFSSHGNLAAGIASWISYSDFVL